MKKVLAFLLMTTLSVSAQEIRLIVPTPTGGGADAYARIIAPQIEKKLNSKIVVENKPGGDGAVALKYLQSNTSDGTKILFLDGEVSLINQILDVEDRYQLSNLSLLGGVYQDSRPLLGIKNKFDSFEKFKNYNGTLYFGSNTRTGIGSSMSSILCYALDLNCKIIIGYYSGGDHLLALDKEEINSLIISESQSVISVANGKTNVLAIMANSRSNYFPEIPTLNEIVKISPDKKRLLDIRQKIQYFGRVLVIPKDTSIDIKNKLMVAIQEALTELEFVEQSKKRNYPIRYVSPETLDNTYKDIMLSVTESDRKMLKQIILDLY